MNKRLQFLLIIAVLVGIIAIAFGGQIANALTATLLLRQEAPDALAVRSVIEESSQPDSMARRFWDTERIPHRYLALSYLVSERKQPEARYSAGMSEPGGFE